MPCLLEFCSTFGKKPERPAWPSLNEGTGHVGDERRHGSAEADPHEGHVNPRAVEGGAEDLIGLVQAVDQVHVGFRRDDGDAHRTGDEDDQRQDHGDEDGQREFLLRLLQLLDVGSVHIDAREAEEHARRPGPGW